ncbi:RNA polymerase III RPC4-domain-containing protein [Lipomyces arxii]|uniref:RNA polymerase III RPC4-domain-containing protein n=1 Tax=Lipomyces arxii TaxID=56418 RepID=UPI0034CD7594
MPPKQEIKKESKSEVRPIPGRLDSLNRPRGGGGGGGLMFKPKLAARRPKDERIATPGPSASPRPAQRESGRGRGRGGVRGGNRDGGVGRDGIASGAAGPFANPAFGDLRAARGPAIERRAPASSMSSARSERSERSESGISMKTDGSDEEAIIDGITRVNIANAVREGEDAMYFPVRNEVIIRHDDEEEEEPDGIDESGEFVDVLGPVDLLERKLLFFQFSPVLPKFTSSDGLVGRLVVRKSGKVSVSWAGAEMEVSKGAEPEFLQDVVVVEQDKATLLGQVARKVVVSPDIDVLLS